MLAHSACVVHGKKATDGMTFRPQHVSEDDLMQLIRNRDAVRGGANRTGHIGTKRAAEREKPLPVARPAPSPYKGYRSKLEYNWANYLDVLKAVKDIEGWRYEPLRFKLPGERNYYKIDFSAWTTRTVTFYELKGWNQSDSRSLVKLKTAAGLNPWAKFVLVKHHDGQWEERTIE